MKVKYILFVALLAILVTNLLATQGDKQPIHTKCSSNADCKWLGCCKSGLCIPPDFANNDCQCPTRRCTEPYNTCNVKVAYRTVTQKCVSIFSSDPKFTIIPCSRNGECPSSSCCKNGFCIPFNYADRDCLCPKYRCEGDYKNCVAEFIDGKETHDCVSVDIEYIPPYYQTTPNNYE